MIPYALQQKDITPEHMSLLDRVCNLVLEYPNDWSCHDVAAAIFSTLCTRTSQPLELVRGTFAGAPHSWLVIRNTNVIIDPYPWATGSGPIILTTEGILNPWRRVYDPYPDKLLRAAEAGMIFSERVTQTEGD